MLHHLVEVWYGWVRDGGYWAIIALMAMESSIIPVPSEIVIPPAAFLAAQGNLSFAGVILAGTFGSYLGSAVSYWASLWIGRPLLAHYGRYFLLGEDKIARAETWLVRYEAGGIFFARLLPVIRHLISIPAGIVRMNFTTFSLMTTLGAASGAACLPTSGTSRTTVEPDLFNQNPEAWEHFIKSHSIWVVVGALALGALYVLGVEAHRQARARPDDLSVRFAACSVSALTLLSAVGCAVTEFGSPAARSSLPLRTGEFEELALWLLLNG